VLSDLIQPRRPHTTGARLIVLRIGLDDHRSPVPECFLETSTIVSSTVTVRRRKSI
jgi:hypothetical protein